LRGKVEKIPSKMASKRRALLGDSLWAFGPGLLWNTHVAKAELALSLPFLFLKRIFGGLFADA
jgi:hypothetical protein